MPELSKTARASLGKQVKEIYTETPEKAIAELRNDRAAHLWPNTQRIDALLAAYDATLALYNGRLQTMAEMSTELAAVKEELRVAKIDNKIYLDRLANRDALIDEQDEELKAVKALFEAANAELDKLEAQRPIGDDGQGVCQGDDLPASGDFAEV